MTLLIANPSEAKMSKIQKLNDETCKVLRYERRKQIYDAIGMAKMDGLRKKVIASATPLELKELQNAANVEANDPFFSSETIKAADDLSKTNFVRASEKVLTKSEEYIFF